MLRSTHKPAPSPASSRELSLPTGWTEHKAPSGHSYYYNAETKQSTYTRPTSTVEVPLQVDYNAITPSFGGPQAPSSTAWRNDGHFSNTNGDRPRGSFRGGRSYQDRSRRHETEDRPKAKTVIPDCAPWILVKTKLGRRFVYNPEKDESYWKFPQDVLLAVMEMDRQERHDREKDESSTTATKKPEPSVNKPPAPVMTKSEERPAQPSKPQPSPEDDSDSYEEVEVTDEEDDDNPDAPSKKQKLEQEEPQGPVEFNEDDIAYQLAQMGEDYGLDPGDYDNGDKVDDEGYENGVGGLPLTEEDTSALFRDLLDDYRINPYTTWEKIIEEGRIIEDDRYTVLPTMSARKQLFAEWSRDRIQELQAKRKQEEKKDPRIAYLRFLHENATPKLYWVEFKRKFKREPEMKDAKLADKDREKMYRDHISRLKLAESTRRVDLEKLLNDTPLRALNRTSTLDTLPTPVLLNLAFISLPAKTRNAIVETHISTLPEAPDASNGELSIEEQAEADRKKEERRKREAALAERERHAQEEKRRQRGALQQGREMNEEAAVQLDRAMRTGKQGLKGYLEQQDQDATGE